VKGVGKVIVKILFLLTSLAIVLFIYKVILPRIMQKLKQIKKYMIKKQKRNAFKNKMKQLEIK